MTYYNQPRKSKISTQKEYFFELVFLDDYRHQISQKYYLQAEQNEIKIKISITNKLPNYSYIMKIK